MTDLGPTPPPSPAPAEDAPDVRFVELAGADARAALVALADAWRRAGADVELLAAVDQEDLWLLVARGGGERDAPGVPQRARVWRFRSAAW